MLVQPSLQLFCQAANEPAKELTLQVLTANCSSDTTTTNVTYLLHLDTQAHLQCSYQPHSRLQGTGTSNTGVFV